MIPYPFFLAMLIFFPKFTVENVKRDLWVIEDDSELTIKGTSNVNSFECSVGNLGRKDTVSIEKDQFKGIDPSSFNIKVKKDGGDVDAITAATISSRAFCDAVNIAVNAYQKMERQ